MNPFILNVSIVILLDLAGIVTAKIYSLNKNSVWLWLAILFFAGTGLFFARSLKYEGAATVNILWVAGSAIVVTLVGYFAFKEDITLIQAIGILIIIIGLIFINLK
ncbi:MAG: EamA family transporter [Candidatus Buchananbacteria bacterium]|nr:EamA family transporter [Candidatus Buchananbacteria bacterium]